MAEEIERKFLVVGDSWRDPEAGLSCRQGYLTTHPERVVRVRAMGGRAYLTIKGSGAGITRPEFEYEIPLGDAEQLFDLCEQPLIEKTRFKIPHEGLVWEVDVFHGANEGLVVAECELEAEDQEIVKPAWVGEEVTADPRYYNARLAGHPFRDW